jgi:hypothetical protein
MEGKKIPAGTLMPKVAAVMAVFARAVTSSRKIVKAWWSRLRTSISFDLL